MFQKTKTMGWSWILGLLRNITKRLLEIGWMDEWTEKFLDINWIDELITWPDIRHSLLDRCFISVSFTYIPHILQKSKTQMRFVVRS